MAPPNKIMLKIIMTASIGLKIKDAIVNAEKQ
jgi:hypothetical protein